MRGDAAVGLWHCALCTHMTLCFVTTPPHPPFPQLKAKTEMLLSAEAAKSAQRADLQNHLETAQHALQDKQQVSFDLLAQQQLGLSQHKPYQPAN